MKTFEEFYEIWAAQTKPSKTTARMVRTALKYVATAAGVDDWRKLAVTAEQRALLLLEAAMAETDLRSQSRSNYRCYLRLIYRMRGPGGVPVVSDDADGMWPAVPAGSGTPSRAIAAYQRFIKWAVGRDTWPGTVEPDDLVQWALDEESGRNEHWRQDYERLVSVWETLAETDGLTSMKFASLPRPVNERYARRVEQWPGHLRREWQRMCNAASAPLRNGGMRPWRETTRHRYEQDLCRLLGWLAIEEEEFGLAGHTWASLLTADRCRDFINWLVARNGKSTLNPSHPAFLRMVRGFHRFLLGSDKETVEEFNELTQRCEVEERDKAVRIVPYPQVERAYRDYVARVADFMKPSRRKEISPGRLAALQVNAIMLGLLVSRALRQRNIRRLQVGKNLVEVDGGYELRYASSEMKGHRAFSTSCPAELVPIVRHYVRHGFQVLTGKEVRDGDILLRSKRGNPLTSTTFRNRVISLSQKMVGKPLHPHIFRHIISTHAAQVWKLTPTELAALLAHRNPMTLMKFYEVTDPAKAAARVDEFRTELS
jgi:site-specific recombinase XerD